MKRGQKLALVFVGVLVGAAVAVFVTLYASGFLFLAFNKVDPTQASPLSIIDYWHWYRGTAADKKLKAAILLSTVVFMLITPIALFAATRSKRSLHGDARFARSPEIEKAGLFVKDPKEPVVLVGKFRERWLGLGGQRFVMLSAPTRSGKGVGVVIPNLLNWPHSVVVNDIKDECFKLTAGFRAACGQRVYRWAPFDAEGRTCQYNPLAYLDPRSSRLVSDVISLGLLFYPDDSKGSSSSDKFFNDQARNLFLAFVLYLIATPERPRTMGELLRLCSGDGKGLKETLALMLSERQAGPRPLRDECVQAFSRFLSAPENTLGSILSTFNAVLTMWADETVDAAMSGNSFDLRDLRRVPTTVYIHVPANRRGASKLLINVFFSQLCEISTETLPESDPTLRYQVLLLLDEFPSLGRVGAISESIAYLAGYNIRLLTITQSHAQLVERYGEHEARNFVTNHGLQVLYTPRELSDAEEYSKRLGNFDYEAESRGRSNSSGKSSSSSSSTNKSMQRRALMLPQEFRAMPFEREVIDLEGCRPIEADKILYWKEPVFQSRLLSPPTVAPLDMELHRARTQGRVRPFSVEEVRANGIERLAHDLQGLVPALSESSSDEDVSRFVDEVFSRLAQTPAPTVAVPDRQAA
jgi:type IV secretion system protein VirD4